MHGLSLSDHFVHLQCLGLTRKQKIGVTKSFQKSGHWRNTDKLGVSLGGDFLRCLKPQKNKAEKFTGKTIYQRIR